jgi:hypothetical protein
LLGEPAGQVQPQVVADQRRGFLGLEEFELGQDQRPPRQRAQVDDGPRVGLDHGDRLGQQVQPSLIERLGRFVGPEDVDPGPRQFIQILVGHPGVDRLLDLGPRRLLPACALFQCLVAVRCCHQGGRQHESGENPPRKIS